MNLVHTDGEVGSKQNQHKQSIPCQQLKIQLSQSDSSNDCRNEGPILVLNSCPNIRQAEKCCEAIVTLSMLMRHRALACVKRKTRGVIPTNRNRKQVKRFSVQLSVLTGTF